MEKPGSKIGDPYEVLAYVRNRVRKQLHPLCDALAKRSAELSLQRQVQRLGPPWKSGNEFLPYHPSASHVSPDHRDGWNQCYLAALDVMELQRRQQPGVTLCDPSIKAELDAEFAGMTPQAARDWLTKCGFLTKAGKLPKQYGGA